MWPANKTVGLAAVTVIGRDRPGIVARVTRTLFELGCNLQDATSTILRGHFTMTLIVDIGDNEPANVEVAAQTEAPDLLVVVRAVEGGDAGAAPTHMVSVYGADRPGILYRVADVLERAGANITDFTCRLIGSEAEPVYAAMLEVTIPDVGATTQELEALRGALGVDVTITPLEAELL